MQEPGSAFRAYLPSVISICMDHIYPIIAEVSILQIVLCEIHYLGLSLVFEEIYRNCDAASCQKVEGGGTAM